ncbi:phosphatidylserine decarboxylase [Desulfatiferula olefinivorans]
MNPCFPHQYIDRSDGMIRTEKLLADKTIALLYSRVRENASLLFRLLTGSLTTDLLACFHYDLPLYRHDKKIRAMIRDLGIDMDEVLEPESIRTVRDLFERKIAYWKTRPMAHAPRSVVSPCDARVIPGSFDETDTVFIKEKFFDMEELLGRDKDTWRRAFEHGTYAVFRLTPDKYHYNHMPVTGRVMDVYEVRGAYHSCNPSAVIELVTPYSKNRRVVTVIDTDVPGGTGAGLVAMVEIVALMIGDIAQVYSDFAYDYPRDIRPGDTLLKGQPKSLFRPGSSTVVLLFQKDRFRFSEDLMENVGRKDVQSRFTKGFGRPLVETDLCVRADIGRAMETD